MAQAAAPERIPGPGAAAQRRTAEPQTRCNGRAWWFASSC